MSASRSLKRLLAERAQVVACGAHDALSAKLVEQAGFDAIWASGFGLSAVRAVPDASILTMSETLEATRAMVDATSIPVIADCDTGFGNAINVMRTVVEFEAAGVAAISIEDNVFPKRCSFYAGVRAITRKSALFCAAFAAATLRACSSAGTSSRATPA